MSKLLITSGCSFSDARNGTSFTNVLINEYQDKFPEQIHLGLGSQANDVISRKAVAHILEHQGRDITLIIYWSTPERKAFLTDDTARFSPEYARPFKSGWLVPVPQGIDYHNRELDCGWSWFTGQETGHIELSDVWYKTYDSEQQNLENILSNMLTVQLVCEKYGVEYHYAHINGAFSELWEKYAHSFFTQPYRTMLDNQYDIMEGNNVYDYVKSLNYDDLYFSAPGDFHPSFSGHKQVLDKFLLPRL